MRRKKKTQCNHIPISARLDGRSVCWPFLPAFLVRGINYCSFHTFSALPILRHTAQHFQPPVIRSVTPSYFELNAEKTSVNGPNYIIYGPRFNYDGKPEMKLKKVEINLTSVVLINQPIAERFFKKPLKGTKERIVFHKCLCKEQERER